MAPKMNGKPRKAKQRQTSAATPAGVDQAVVSGVPSDPKIEKQLIANKPTMPNEIQPVKLAEAAPVPVKAPQSALLKAEPVNVVAPQQSTMPTALATASLALVDNNKDNEIDNIENIENIVDLSEIVNNNNNNKERTKSASSSVIDPEEGVKIDTARMQRRFSAQSSQEEVNSTCKICDKHVYQMERILAVKSIYHKQCFRCLQCNTQLRIDNYASHEGQIYCKAHHKQLFQPKPTFDADGSDEMANKLRIRRKQMIICENEPAELPDGVVRCNAKVDDGIDSLNLNLGNLRERFEQASQQQNQSVSSPQAVIDKPSVSIKQTLAAFDRQLSIGDNDQQAPSSNHVPAVKRSESIMNRLKKYEAAMAGEKIASDAGDEDLDPLTDPDDGADINNNSSNGKPDVASIDLSSLKQQWEQGKVNTQREKLTGERKEELSKVRQTLAHGRNESVKKIYETAVQEAASNKPQKSESIVLNFPTKANSLKEKFELGLVNSDQGDSEEMSKIEQLRQEKLNDLSIFQEGETGAREARNMFKQIDRRLSSSSSIPSTPSSLNTSAAQDKDYHSISVKNGLTNGTVTAAARRRLERRPVARSNTIANCNGNVDKDANIEVVKCSDPAAKENITVETTKLREKFNFFENYREEPRTQRRFEMTPPREIIANGRKYSTVTSDSDSDDDNDNYTQYNGADKRMNENGHTTMNGNDSDKIVRCSTSTRLHDLPKTDIARKMLDKFKQLEDGSIVSSNSSNGNQTFSPQISTSISAIKQTLLSPTSAASTAAAKDSISNGKPCLKRITPPREYTLDHPSDEDDNSASEQQPRDPNIIRYGDKVVDEIPVEPEKARSLRMKFESWAANQSSSHEDDDDADGKTNSNGAPTSDSDFFPQIDTTRNLRAKFEAFTEESTRRTSLRRPQARVNRFVVSEPLSANQ